MVCNVSWIHVITYTCISLHVMHAPYVQRMIRSKYTFGVLCVSAHQSMDLHTTHRQVLHIYSVIHASKSTRCVNPNAANTSSNTKKNNSILVYLPTSSHRHHSIPQNRTTLNFLLLTHVSSLTIRLLYTTCMLLSSIHIYDYHVVVSRMCMS